MSEHAPAKIADEVILWRAVSRADYVALAESHRDLLAALKNAICWNCGNKIGYTGPVIHPPSLEKGDWRMCRPCAEPRAAITKAEAVTL